MSWSKFALPLGIFFSNCDFYALCLGFRIIKLLLLEEIFQVRKEAAAEN